MFNRKSDKLPSVSLMTLQKKMSQLWDCFWRKNLISRPFIKLHKIVRVVNVISKKFESEGCRETAGTSHVSISLFMILLFSSATTLCKSESSQGNIIKKSVLGKIKWKWQTLNNIAFWCRSENWQNKKAVKYDNLSLNVIARRRDLKTISLFLIFWVN